MFSNDTTTPTRPPQLQQGNPTLLHRFLGIGLVLLAGAMIIVKSAIGAGDAQDETPLPAYVIAGISFLMCATALMLMKPLVPRREAGQTREAYWANPAVAAKAMRVWFILEGAGVMASVSYFLGGGLISAALIALTVAVYWMNGPSTFAGE